MLLPIPSLDGLLTERLHFRCLTLDDQAAWMPFIRSAEAMRFLGRGYGTEEVCTAWFQRQLGRYAAGEGGLHALLDRSTGAFVGQAGMLVQEVAGARELEVGYHLLPEAWGKGYATEAARACMAFAQERRIAPSITSLIHSDNHRSTAVAKRNGLVWERHVTMLDLPVEVYRFTPSTSGR